MKNTTLRLLLVLLWILILLAGYYWGHKPFDLSTAAGIGRVLLDLMVVFLALWASGTIGRRLVPADNLSALERPILQCAAGMGLLSLLWLALGSIGLFHPPAAWGMVLGALLAFPKRSMSWLKDFGAGLKDLFREASTLDRVLLSLTAFLALLQVLAALAPPTKYDALTYHLQLPRQYIKAGELIFTPANPYWGHPQLGEMLFTWMGLLHRSQTGALLSAAWGLLVLLGLAATTRRLVISIYQRIEPGAQAYPPPALTAGLAAAAILLSGSTFRWMLGWAYTDQLSALMGWGALACVLALLEQSDGSGDERITWLLWVGVFCGFAIGVKWSGALLPAGFFLALLLLRNQLRLPLRFWLLGAALVLLTAAPWLLKNLMATGNPLYPYFLATEWISPQRLAAASGGDSPLPLWQTLLFPLTSTIFGWDSAPGFGADLGPLLALLALPGLWYAGRKRLGVILALPLALVWLVVILGGFFFNHLQQPRLYFALLPLVGAAAGLGWAGLSRLRVRMLRLERLLAALMVLILALTAVQDLRRTAEQAPLRTLLGVEPAQSYLERNLGMYALVMQALEELPPGSQTLMLWEGRGFYASESAASDPWIDRWRADYWRFGSAQEVLVHWRGEGFTHLLLYQTGMQAVRSGGSPLEPVGWEALDTLLASLPEPTSFGSVYKLYSLGSD